MAEELPCVVVHRFRERPLQAAYMVRTMIISPPLWRTTPTSCSSESQVLLQVRLCWCCSLRVFLVDFVVDRIVLSHRHSHGHFV